jgi:hypothetical protein
MSIIRANYIAFPISPRNSAPAIAHLINKVNVTHILLGHEQSMLDLVDETLEVLQSEYPSSTKPGISPIPLFHDLYLGPSTSVNMDDLPITRNESDDIMFYLHSSGDYFLAIPIANN